MNFRKVINNRQFDVCFAYNIIKLPGLQKVLDMTFLNPLALLGLAAAAIPILLHIFNLRKLQKIEFSTLSFLKELQKTKIRRLKLRQLLLLILRTLLIILIVLAFSRPTLKGSLPGKLAEEAKTTAVIIFDDSQSMSASNEKGALLQQAKISAVSILNSLKDGDECFLTKLSEVPVNETGETPSPQHDFSLMQKNIKDIGLSPVTRTVEEGLRYASRLLASSKNFNREVYVISDFQSGSLESKNTSKTTEDLFTAATHFFLVRLKTSELQNISIASIEIPAAIFEVNRPFTINAKITNHSSSGIRNQIVSLFENGIHTAQKGVDISAGQSVETEFTVVPRQAGFLEGKIELEDDELEFDNKRYFTIKIPEEVKVLLIGDPSENKYLRLALNTKLSDTSSSFKITESVFDRLSTSLLNNTDVVVLNDPPELSQSQAAVIKNYVQNGGGAFIFPGRNMTVNSFNAAISNPLGISTAVKIDSFSRTTNHEALPAEIAKIDFRHPLFSGMFEKPVFKKNAGPVSQQPGIESPRVLISFRFIPTSRSKIVAALSNDSPFLIEDYSGDGRILISSVASNTNWSDFPVKALFMPLVHRSAVYLSQGSITGSSILAGKERISKIRTPGISALTVIKPGGMEILTGTRQRTAERILRFSDTDLNGIYTVMAGNILIDKFAVNINPDESDLNPPKEEQLINLLKRLGIEKNAVHTVQQAEETQRIIMESRLGAELWKHFLIAAILIAVIEMLASRNSKRSVSGETLETNK
ncbi:MAG: VWA domain-containing protein [Bacteroidetes bacterium]|nr:VWA domain-containing protein [Bacteroidota bacterium]